MENMIKMMLISIGMAIVLTGCGKSAPECGSDDVKNIILNIVEREYIKTLSFFAAVSPLSTDQILENPDISENDKESIRKAIQIYRNSNPAVLNIRTENTNNDIQKSECAADVQVNAKNPILQTSTTVTLPITYHASITTDGKLYVEVLGLK